LSAGPRADSNALGAAKASGAEEEAKNSTVPKVYEDKLWKDKLVGYH
jgi:hypothetical protein